jgi:hypothetical protein
VSWKQKAAEEADLVLSDDADSDVDQVESRLNILSYRHRYRYAVNPYISPSFKSIRIHLIENGSILFPDPPFVFFTILCRPPYHMVGKINTLE